MANRVFPLAFTAIFLFICLLGPTSLLASDSSIEIALRLQDGHFAVERDASKIELEPAFLGASKLDQGEVAKVLYDDIDAFLASQTPPYLLSLDDSERETVGSCGGDSDSAGATDIAAVCELTSASWAEAQVAFDAWAGEAPDGHSRLKLAFVLFQNIGALVDGLAGYTAFFSTEENFPGVATGRFSGLISPPIGGGDQAFAVKYRNGATAETAALEPPTIRRLLRPFEGRLWRPAQIRARLQKIYSRRLGFTSKISVSPAGPKPRQIAILESSRLARISAPKLDAGILAKIFFYLLPDRQYRRLMADGDITSHLQEIDGFWILDFQEAFGRSPETLPYLDSHLLQSQLLSLAAIGYSAELGGNSTLPAGDDAFYQDLIVLKLDTDTTVSRQSSDPNRDDDINTLASDSNLDSSQLDRALTLSRLATDKNFIGGGVDWRPDQGAHAFALYRRRPISGDQGDLLIVAGGAGEALGNVSFDLAFLPVGKWRLPLSLTAKSSSEFTPDRSLAGGELDERRRGARIHASLQLFRDRAGSAFSISAGLRQVEVEILDGETTTLEEDLSLLELGVTWSRASMWRAQPAFTKISAKAILGLDIDDQPDFQKIVASASYHRYLPARFEFDQRLHLAWASSETPFYELPALGGADNLRGFRTDAALGEQLWSLQNELWAPLTPWEIDSQNKILSFLSQLRLALFVDVGDVEDAFLSTSGTRAGAGVGLRYTRSPITLGVDWGYGFESPLASERESKVYLSFRRLLP